MYIFFDVHGVLTDGSERKRFLEQMERKYGIEHEQHNSLWNAHLDNLDKGLENASEFISVINQTFHTDLSVKEYYEIFIEQIIVNEALLEKLRKIKLHEMYIVSDNFLPIPMGLNRIFGKRFKKWRKFYSFRFGMTKSKGLLKKVIKILKVDPKTCLFVDDNNKNIEMAEKIGIDAILFKTNEELFHDLKIRKILI